jgi:hypothetical protein
MHAVVGRYACMYVRVLVLVRGARGYVYVIFGACLNIQFAYCIDVYATFALSFRACTFCYINSCTRVV